MFAAAAVAQSPKALALRIGPKGLFMIDPQTSRLDASLRWALAADGELKPAYHRLFARYLRNLDEPQPHGHWTPIDGAEREVFIGNVLEYQDREFERRRNADLELFDIEVLPTVRGAIRPERLLGPYLLIDRPEDLHAQLALWSDTPMRYRGRPVDFVLAVHPRMLGHFASLKTLPSAARDRRVWLALPEFRDHARSVKGHLVAQNAIRLGRLVGAESELALFTSSFELASIAAAWSQSVVFSPHLTESRVAKRGGGRSLPVAYVPAVHDWVGYSRVSREILEFGSAAELAAKYCDDPDCLRMFRDLGPRRFAARLFGTRSSGSHVVATAQSWNSQFRHGIRSRVREVDAFANMTMTEAIQELEASAGVTPFRAAARHLQAWAMALRFSEKRAA